MSFAEARIEEYRTSKASKDQPLTEVLFIEARIGNVDLGLIAEKRTTPTENEVSEDHIERQLADDGLIRLPPNKEQTRPEFEPIEVGGKPISEMIIEERR